MVIEPHTAHIYFVIFLIFIKPINSRENHITDKIAYFTFISNSRNFTNNIIMFNRQL